jgi:hypothetical protein
VPATRTRSSRAIVSTVAGLRVRSRRGWDMTERVQELAGLPEGLVLDGELVAIEDGRPSFPRLANRVLHGHDGIAITFVVFDVLASDGESTMALSYGTDGRYWSGSSSPVADGVQPTCSTTASGSLGRSSRRASKGLSPSRWQARTGPENATG